MDNQYKRVTIKERVMEIANGCPIALPFTSLCAYLSQKGVPDAELRSMILTEKTLEEKGIIVRDETSRTNRYTEALMHGVVPDENERRILSGISDTDADGIKSTIHLFYDLVQILMPGWERNITFPVIKMAKNAKTERLYSLLNEMIEEYGAEDGGESMKMFAAYVREMRMLISLGVEENGQIRWVHHAMLNTFDETDLAVMVFQAVRSMYTGKILMNEGEKDVTVRYVSLISPGVGRSQLDAQIMISRVKDGVLTATTAEELMEQKIKLPFGMDYADQEGTWT